MESGDRLALHGAASGRAGAAAGSRAPNGQREIIAGFARDQRVFASRADRRAVVDGNSPNCALYAFAKCPR